MFWLDDLIIYFAVVAGGFARDYFGRYRARREESLRLRAEAVQLQAQSAQLQAQLADARLSALRTQLNPHFLFNTLNAISTLVERDPRGVRRMIARLSELLRYSLATANDQEAPLERELEFVERYLEIMQVRFEGKLEVQTDIETGVRDALVPTLLLQTLVENAVKHGIDRLKSGGRIEIGARRVGEQLVIHVRDNGPGVDAAMRAAGEREGVGLRNTRARLGQLYGDAYRLTLEPAHDGRTVVSVTVPFHTTADLRTTAGPARQFVDAP
jgi:sensor histidine kinase YesM